MGRPMSASSLALHADSTSTAIGGLVVIGAMIVFGLFLGRLARFLLPIVRSWAYLIVLGLALLLWLLDPVLGLGLPRIGFLVVFAGLLLLRLAVELAAPRGRASRRAHGNPPESQYDAGLHHPGRHEDWGDGGGDHGGGDGSGH